MGDFGHRDAAEAGALGEEAADVPVGVPGRAFLPCGVGEGIVDPEGGADIFEEPFEGGGAGELAAVVGGDGVRPLEAAGADEAAQGLAHDLGGDGAQANGEDEAGAVPLCYANPNRFHEGSVYPDRVAGGLHGLLAIGCENPRFIFICLSADRYVAKK